MQPFKGFFDQGHYPQRLQTLVTKLAIKATRLEGWRAALQGELAVF